MSRATRCLRRALHSSCALHRSSRVAALQTLGRGQPQGAPAGAGALPPLRARALAPPDPNDPMDCVVGIETTCDDTGVAVLGWRRGAGGSGRQQCGALAAPAPDALRPGAAQPIGSDDDDVYVLADVLASQHALHAAFAGVVPHYASRAHEASFPRVLARALELAQLAPSVDAAGAAAHPPPAPAAAAAAPPARRLLAIGVATGPGMAMCLQAGLAGAQAASARLGAPLVPVNHLEGHLLVPRLVYGPAALPFPYLVLLVSGGHTQLVLAHGVGRYSLLGDTRDDSLGECFDKVARLLRAPEALAALQRQGGPVAQAAAAAAGAARRAPPPLHEEDVDVLSCSGAPLSEAPRAAASAGGAGAQGGAAPDESLEARARALRAALRGAGASATGRPLTIKFSSSSSTAATAAAASRAARELGSVPPVGAPGGTAADAPPGTQPPGGDDGAPPPPTPPPPPAPAHLGAALEALARHGVARRVAPPLPVPLRHAAGPVSVSFSFSGLKSAVARRLGSGAQPQQQRAGGEQQAPQPITACTAVGGGEQQPQLAAAAQPRLSAQTCADMAAAFQLAAVSHVCEQLSRALAYCALRAHVDGDDAVGGAPASDGRPPPPPPPRPLPPPWDSYAVRHVVVCGGVAANAYLRAAVAEVCAAHGRAAVFPPARYCTDNGVMIAWAATERLHAGLHALSPAQAAADAAAVDAGGAAAVDAARGAAGAPGAGAWQWDTAARWRLGYPPPPSLNVDEVHLFVDLVDGLDPAGTVNASIVLGTVTKDYTIAVTNTTAWEEQLHFYTSAVTVPPAVSPTGLGYFALYYACTYGDAAMGVCYANSSDGRAWTKPLFDEILYHGAPTNIVFQVNASSQGSWPGSVLLDTAPGVPPAERFKLTYEGQGANRTMYLATSPDGVAWARRAPEVPVIGVRLFSDTQTAVVYDAPRGVYAAFGRRDSDLGPNASVGCDGASRSLRRVMLATSATSAAGGYGDPVQVLGPGAPDAYSCLDVYNPAPIQVPGSPTLLLLPSSYLHLPTDQASQPYVANGLTSNDGFLDVRLAASRNGAAFDFVSRDAFLPRGTGYRQALSVTHAAWSGAFTALDSDLDAGFVFATAGGMLDTDLLAPPPPAGGAAPPLWPFRVPSKRVGLLYWGGQRTHGGDPAGGWQGVLRASLRREGFAAVRTPPADPVGAAAIRTLPLTVPAPDTACPGVPRAQLWLLLNAQTSVAGQVAVALLAPGSLQPLPGYEPQSAVAFVGDAVRAPAGWAPGGNASSPLLSRDLAPLAGTTVVVQVRLVHAQLFAWQVQCVPPF